MASVVAPQTTERPDADALRQVPATSGHSVRRRRRPGLLAASVALICLGALLTGWAFQHVGHTRSVLAARHLIERGSTIGANDLVVVQVGVDPALHTVGSQTHVVGQYALSDIPAGSLLTAESIGAQVSPARGISLVGIRVSPGQMPSVGLLAGDHVDVLATSGDAAPTHPAAAPISGTVFHVSEPDDNAIVTVDMAVPDAVAASLAQSVASGHLAIILRSREH